MREQTSLSSEWPLDFPLFHHLTVVQNRCSLAQLSGPARLYSAHAWEPAAELSLQTDGHFFIMKTETETSVRTTRPSNPGVGKHLARLYFQSVPSKTRCGGGDL